MAEALAAPKAKDEEFKVVQFATQTEQAIVNPETGEPMSQAELLCWIANVLKKKL